jgi:tetratricopeptide (TPR) repeat protein
MPNKFSQFWQELKRRKVTRLATVYIVVGFGIIEAIDIIGGRFQFPDWTVRLIIIIIFAGFPVAMVLGWIYDITAGRIERTQPLTPSEKALQPPLTWRPSWVSVLLFIALIFLSVAFFVVPRANALGFQKRDWILVADLENNTGDEVFDQSLMQALTITIDQSRYVNIYPRKRVMEVLRRMQVENVDKIDVSLALEIAERENIRSVLAVTISELDNTYILSTRLLNPYTGETVRSRQEMAEGRTDILPKLDKLATAVRRDLGESPGQVVGRRLPLAKATTPSLEALKLYTEGSIAWGRGQWQDAQTLWTHALELDSGFAWPNASLGLAAEFLGNDSVARVYYDRALSRLDRVTEKEKLWITALTLDGAEAADAYHTYLREYPDDRDGWYNLGNQLRAVGRYEEAIEAYEKSLMIDPMFAWSHENLGVLYDDRGQINEAAAHFETAFQIYPEDAKNWRGDINRISGFVLVKKGDTVRARERFELLLDMGEDARASGLRSLALLKMYQGYHSSATALFKQAVVINQQRDQSLSEFRNRMYLARAYQTMGKYELMADELAVGQALAEEYGFSPLWVIYLAILQAQTGDLAHARGWLDRWTGSHQEAGDNAWRVEFLRGEIELAEGNPAGAIASVELADQIRIHENGEISESLGRAYMANGQPEKAVAPFTRTIELMQLGHETQEPWVLAHYRLGLVHEALGNKKEAKEYFTRFLDLWGSGDPGLAGVDDARSRVQ